MIYDSNNNKEFNEIYTKIENFLKTKNKEELISILMQDLCDLEMLEEFAWRFKIK